MTSKKTTMQSAWKMNIRAWKIWWKLCPGFFFSAGISSIVKALTPYVTIFLSAQIINELSGNRNVEVLSKWVILTLTCTSLCALLNSILNHWLNYEKSSAQSIDREIYMKKMLHLDYEDIERQTVFDLYSQIIQTKYWSGWGIYKTLLFFEELVTALFQILGGISLSISLFAAKVPKGSELEPINHPLFAVGILILLLLIAILSPMCKTRGDRYMTNYAQEARLGNRFFYFFGFMSHDKKRATDLRMYQQQENICTPRVTEYPMFSAHSDIAKSAMGPMGLLHALSQCMSVILTGVVYLYVCLKAWAGAFGVGSVTQYIGAITQLFGGVSAFLTTVGCIQSNGEFLVSNFKFLDLPNPMYQGSLTTEKRSDRKYEVEFRDVSFRYPDTEQWALRHINLKFQIGKRLAVVGMNGSGKTTFIKLLCRLYDPTEGHSFFKWN